MEGTKPWRAAEIEALEEAGVTGHVSQEANGDYHCMKTLDNRVTLFPMIVPKPQASMEGT